MQRIFTDEKFETQITENGYTVVKELLPADTCDELSRFFELNEEVDNRAFTISNWNNNKQYRNKIYDKVTHTLLPFTKRLLYNYIPVLGVYTIKRPGKGSDMILHQDWSLVDESKYRSVSVWVALTDIDRENGNLQVAVGSHLYAGYPRGMNTPVPFENIRSHVQQHYLTDVPVKKGDAIIFDHRLIHASPPNHSSRMRLVAVMALIPESAELLHYYKPPGNEKELEVLKLDIDEFRNIDFFDVPNEPKHTAKLGKISAEFVQLTTLDIIK